MQITWPSKVRRDAYVRVYATFSPEELATAGEGQLWSRFVNACQDVFGVVCTEDNTVGQIAQMHSIKTRGCASCGSNLYGMRVTPINQRLASKKVA